MVCQWTCARRKFSLIEISVKIFKQVHMQIAMIGLSVWTLDCLILRMELENIGFHSQIGALKSTTVRSAAYLCGKGWEFSLENLGFESGFLPLCICAFLLPYNYKLYLFTSHVWIVSWVLGLGSFIFCIMLVLASKSKPFIMFRMSKNNFAVKYQPLCHD